MPPLDGGDAATLPVTFARYHDEYQRKCGRDYGDYTYGHGYPPSTVGASPGGYGMDLPAGFADDARQQSYEQHRRVTRPPTGRTKWLKARPRCEVAWCRRLHLRCRSGEEGRRVFADASSFAEGSLGGSDRRRPAEEPVVCPTSTDSTTEGDSEREHL